MKKVYFACSIRGGGDTSQYVAISQAIKACGATILSEIFINDAIHLGGSPLPEDQIYQRDIAWINEADIVVAEVTNPSLGVGYELAYAETLGKPVLCLFSAHSDKRLSAMIAGNPHFTCLTYTPNSLPDEKIRTFIEAV